MKINNVVVGVLGTNCYMLENDNNVLIIDPGDEEEKISEAISDNSKVIGIIITHSHFDHIGALTKIKDKYHVPVYDRHNLKEGINKIKNFSFEIIYTPGHLDDAITIYFPDDKVMFVGDFIFKGSIGRTDMEGGSPEDMKNSIEKILKYPEDIVLYPGHVGKTSLGEEKDNLKYFLSVL